MANMGNIISALHQHGTTVIVSLLAFGYLEAPLCLCGCRLRLHVRYLVVQLFKFVIILYVLNIVLFFHFDHISIKLWFILAGIVLCCGLLLKLQGKMAVFHSSMLQSIHLF